MVSHRSIFSFKLLNFLAGIAISELGCLKIELSHELDDKRKVSTLHLVLRSLTLYCPENEHNARKPNVQKLQFLKLLLNLNMNTCGAEPDSIWKEKYLQMVR